MKLDPRQQARIDAGYALAERAIISASTDDGQYDIKAMPYDAVIAHGLGLTTGLDRPENHDRPWLVALDEGNGYVAYVVDGPLVSVNDALDAWRGDGFREVSDEIWDNLRDRENER